MTAKVRDLSQLPGELGTGTSFPHCRLAPGPCVRQRSPTSPAPPLRMGQSPLRTSEEAGSGFSHTLRQLRGPRAGAEAPQNIPLGSGVRWLDQDASPTKYARGMLSTKAREGGPSLWAVPGLSLGLGPRGTVTQGKRYQTLPRATRLWRKLEDRSFFKLY